jgi:hypothetical protein
VRDGIGTGTAGFPAEESASGSCWATEHPEAARAVG